MRATYKKNIDKFSAWNLIEVLSFGDFINFYSCYYNTYGYAEKTQWSTN